MGLNDQGPPDPPAAAGSTLQQQLSISDTESFAIPTPRPGFRRLPFSAAPTPRGLLGPASTVAGLPPRATLVSRLNQEIQIVSSLIQSNYGWSTSTPSLRGSLANRHLVQVPPPQPLDPSAAAAADALDPPPLPMYVILDGEDEEEEELAGEALVALELRVVRAQMFSWMDWSTVEPLTYLSPFLYAIRSPLTSTPVTAAALFSVHNILTTDFFNAQTSGAALAIHVLVESVTSCRFEVRDPVSEELVLMRILHVLLACLQCPASELLSDRAVCTVVNTCFRVLHQSAAKGELLQRMAAHVMREMIRSIFLRLPDAAALAMTFADVVLGQTDEEAGAEEDEALEGEGQRSDGGDHLGIGKGVDVELGGSAQASPTAGQAADEKQHPGPSSARGSSPRSELVGSIASPAQARPITPHAIQPSKSAGESEPGDVEEEGGEEVEEEEEEEGDEGEEDEDEEEDEEDEEEEEDDEDVEDEEVDEDEGETDAARGSEKQQLLKSQRGSAKAGAQGKSAAVREEEGEAEPQLQEQQTRGVLVEVGRPHGIACMVEIFQFLCSLLSVEDQYGAPLLLGGASEVGSGEDDVPLFALQLISCALELGGGESFIKHPKMLRLVQDNLMHNLLHLACTSPGVPMLALVCNTVLFLFLSPPLRRRLKLQFEAFLSFALVRLVQEKYAASPQHQEVALEALVDLCRQPTFAAEMYANFDCDLTSSNTFEDICTQLSRAAFPVSLPLTRIHVLALQGLLALLWQMSIRVDMGPAPKPPAPPSIKSQDPLHYELLWTAQVSGPDAHHYETGANTGGVSVEVQNWVDDVRRRKLMKRRLMTGADQFNRDPSRGLLYLQTYHLLPPELDAVSVARFLRFTPGINKTVLGTFLGDHDPFRVDVLYEFSRLFDFTHMTLDAALRIFLESFRLPGEAQKISRILESFAERYYEQCRNNVLANKDAAFILAYSVIMLNTDQHNGQVRRKMTEEEFIRNNRSINDGKDLPRAMLADLYHSIARDEIRVSTEVVPGHLDITQSRWMDILRKSASPSAAPYVVCRELSPVLDYDMFSIIAGPTIAAISVVFDHTDEEQVLRQCVTGFLNAAKVCAAHCMRDTLDDLVVSLCKFTTLLQPLGVGGRDKQEEEEEVILQFAGDVKAHLSASAMFRIANRYGDYVRTGWRNILDCVLRLHKLGLLPASVLQEAREAWAGVGADREGQTPPPQQQQQQQLERSQSGAEAAASGPGGGQGEVAQKSAPLTTLALSRAQGISVGRKKGKGFMARMGQLFLGASGSLDDDELPEAVQAAQRKVLETVSQWHIEAIFADSKFLQADSLLHLVKALIWAATRAQGGAAGMAAYLEGLPSPKAMDEVKEDEDTAVFCLDLLFGVTLANRDRISLLWPAVAEHLSTIFLSAEAPPTILLEKAVLGMLQMCHRLLAYKEDVADELLRSLQLILKLEPEVASLMCPRVTQQVLLLVQSYCSAGLHVQSGPAWRTVFLLLAASARHQTAADIGLEALRFVLLEDQSQQRHVTRSNFLPCVDLARDFAAASTHGPTALRRAVKAMELLGGLPDVLVKWADEERARAKASGAEADSLVAGGGWVVVQRVNEGAGTTSPKLANQGPKSEAKAKAKASIGDGEEVGEAEDLQHLWLKLVLSLARACRAERRESVRLAAVASLGRCVDAGRKLAVQWDLCLIALQEGMLKLVEELLKQRLEAQQQQQQNQHQHQHPHATEGSLELALQVLSRAVVECAPLALAAPDNQRASAPKRGSAGDGNEQQVRSREETLGALWLQALEAVGLYVQGPPPLDGEKVEKVVGMILRPALGKALALGLLQISVTAEAVSSPGKASVGRSRWDRTWAIARSISPELTPDEFLQPRREAETVSDEALAT